MRIQLLGLFLGVSAWATPDLMKKADSMKNTDRPCQLVKAACESAGFVKGGHKDGKGLWKDCLGPLMDGKSVNGVSLGADQVNACKARRKEHKKLKSEG